MYVHTSSFWDNWRCCRVVRRIKEGTCAVVLQSGLDEKWWADSMECCCYLRNIQNKLSDGKTPYERRFGEPFIRPIVPFCSLVEYHPISTKDKSRIHQVGKKILPGIFLSYVLYAAGIWKGDILVVELEELEEMDTSEIHAKRPDAEEVILPKSGENCKFPDVQDLLADGRTPHERRFGEPFKGPIIPFGSMVEHHPISFKRPVMILQVREQSVARHTPRTMRCTRWEPGKETGCVEELVNLGAPEIHARRSMRKKW